MKWAEGPMVGFDLETTGVNPFTDRIVTACLVDIGWNQRPSITRWLANPGVEIPEGATAVHGITTEHARTHGRPIDQVLFEVTGRLALAMHRGIPVVGANLPFDLTMLEVENRRHGIDPLTSRLPRIEPCVDVMVLDKHVDPYRKAICANNKVPCHCGAVSKKLVDLCKHYGVILSADGAHDASTDALAACRLFPRILAKAKELQSYPLMHLHVQQGKWRAEQMKSLASYFRRRGEHEKAETCDPGWPLLTPPADQPLEGLAS